MAAKYLGDHVVSKFSFPNLDGQFRRFVSKEFQGLPQQKQRDALSKTLYELIQKSEDSHFVLPAVMEFIERVHLEKIVDQYHFNHFELWLNQHSGLSFGENYRIRSKIVGRFVPRDAYQIYFPIGMGKVHPGSHFVTAHNSPDLDTTVASFWGWVDAFGARVSEGLHIWNVPGGAPPAVEVDFLFYPFLGKEVFHLLAKNRAALSVSGLDLVTQNGVVQKVAADSAVALDLEKQGSSVIMVDEEGFYLGEWRGIDVENVRFVINLLNQCLRWYENNLNFRLVSFFAKEDLTKSDLQSFLAKMFQMKISECEPATEFSAKHQRLVEDYLVRVLKVSKGLNETFEGFARAMEAFGIADFQQFIDLATGFGKNGKLQETRSQIFTQLAQIIQALDKAIYAIRQYVDKLGVALSVKSVVLGMAPHQVSYRAELDEIRSKLDHFPYVTVTSPEGEGKSYPLGVIHASDLYKTTLGTVTLRDFCNREETKISPFLEVISVIDHHKSSLLTSAPPVAFITDAQSSNALVAQMSFSITDQYSTGGMSTKEIEDQIASLKLESPSSKRVLQRLLQKSLNAKKEGGFFVAPEREMVEYLQFLYAILDDTDLLTKISTRDVECIASLLNRMKSLSLRQEVEVLNFDEISPGRGFAKAAAKKILQNGDMYSLYSKIYASKEIAAAENLRLCVSGKPSTVFADTKEQNGCCRVGQTKLFAKNIPEFEKHVMEIRRIWLADAQRVYHNKSEVDLHLHMVSTIAGAEELYSGSEGKYQHEDEIWFWIPQSETAAAHLKSFLNAFRSSPQVIQNKMEVDFLGDNSEELKQIFTESFIPVSCKKADKKTPIAVLRFRAGTINSRKAMISPYLPIL